MEKDLELRSEKVRRLIGGIPSIYEWKWIILIIFVLSIVIFVFCIFKIQVYGKYNIHIGNSEEGAYAFSIIPNEDVELFPISSIINIYSPNNSEHINAKIQEIHKDYFSDTDTLIISWDQEKYQCNLDDDNYYICIPSSKKSIVEWVLLSSNNIIYGQH